MNGVSREVLCGLFGDMCGGEGRGVRASDRCGLAVPDRYSMYSNSIQGPERRVLLR